MVTLHPSSSSPKRENGSVGQQRNLLPREVRGQRRPRRTVRWASRKQTADDQERQMSTNDLPQQFMDATVRYAQR